MNKSEKFDLLGVEFEWKLTDAETNYQYCVLEATLPPGVVVPPHRHPDQEAFLVLEGAPEFATETRTGVDWSFSVPGEMVNMPSMTLHGLRNPTTSDARVLITCGINRAQFFAAAGLPFERESPYRSGIPGAGQVQRVIRIAERYGHVFPTQKPGEFRRSPMDFAIQKLVAHPSMSSLNRAYLF